MKKPQPPAATIYPWLKANLGEKCLAPLTSTDAHALTASVHIVQLMTTCGMRDPFLLTAYRVVVEKMQPHNRYLAFHAIAHVSDWSYRRSLWIDSGLAGPNADQLPTTRCKSE